MMAKRAGGIGAALVALLIVVARVPVVTAATTPGLPVTVLTDQQRAKFLNDAESALRASAHVDGGFWPWLKRHADIRAGLLTSADPVPAVYAQNLDQLRKALGPAIADRYANLLLGVSLSTTVDPVDPHDGDGAYNASAYSAPAASADSTVQRVAGYLRQNHLSLLDFVDKTDETMSSLQLPPLKKNQRAAFIDNVAYATRTYPARVPLPLVPELKILIARYETRLPAFQDKGPQWPLFAIDKAPFPLLAPLRQTLPKNELDYLWDRFNGRIAGAKDRLPTYGHYTFDYEKPEVRYKQSDWNPSSLPRIIEDGGVCGRLSTLAQLAAVALGRPAVGMYQPGHRALLTYRQDAKTGHYLASLDQSITTPEKSTNQWFMPPLNAPRVRENGRVVGVEYHVALALSMNLGVNRYTDCRIALSLANRLPVTNASQKLAWLRAATALDPYNLQGWYAWAALLGTDTAAINDLLSRMDQQLAHPGTGLAPSRELAANTDLAAVTTAKPADLQRQSNLVASVVGDVIAEQAYKRALAESGDHEKDKSNLTAEIARRAAMKLPHGESVTKLAE